MAVQVAADVGELDEIGELARRRRRDLAVALAQLGLDVGEAEALVDLSLVGVLGDGAGLGLEDPVLGHREALLDRALAQVDVVLGRAGEVLEQVAVGVGSDDPQIDRDPVVGDDLGAGGCRRSRACATSPCSVSASARAFGSVAVAIRSMSLQVSARRRAEPAISTASLAGCARSALASSSAMGRTSESSSRSSGPSEPSFAERGEHVLLGLRAETLDRPDPLALGRLAKVVEARDAELVVELAHGLRSEPGDPGDLDQRRRDTWPSASPPPGSRRSPSGRRSSPGACRRCPACRWPYRRPRARRPRPGSGGSPVPPPCRR